ncbi:hypothetical protein D9758_000596 [Tetrapyrgos nigripes]|uniref:RlpA-like protein double-psi beta-barrel domain-containing protein n=1 Tax=Tetrapyrgos nigripes TaxID=182062 RepID=A0A8H5GYZ8_9AGAR|nr:hypothetical protein D9758_000596 [Tetrapyrgos nigripes]
MFALSLVSTLALSALSTNAFVIPRSFSPPGYANGYLEDYQTYHTRYLALGCQFQHGKPYFDTCCRPMLATENLKDNRAPECIPSASASASAAEVVATEDCEEEGDEPESTSLAPEPTTPAPTSSHKPAHTRTSTPAAEPTTSAAPTSTPEPEPTTSAAPAPAPTTHREHTSSSEAPQPTSDSGSSSGSSGGSSGGLAGLTGLITGGFGTFFYQNGVAGACGTVHSDNDLIVAMDTAQYGNTSKQSDLCGKKVQIFNAKNNKSVTCTIADACPTCNNGNSIDMSVAAFQQLASLDEGLIDIKWKLLD